MIRAPLGYRSCWAITAAAGSGDECSTPHRRGGVASFRRQAEAKHRAANGALITLREPPSSGPKIRHRPRERESVKRETYQGEKEKVKLGRQAARPFHCSRNARPQKALVGRAQPGPTLLPAQKRPPARRGRRNKETKEQRHPSSHDVPDWG